MTVPEILAELEAMATPSTKKTWLNHGAKEPLFGVKIGDMKTIVKRVKKDYQLALDLFATGNADAMYLAGLIADDEKMTVKDLENWVKTPAWSMISEYAVPWVAAGSKHGQTLAMKWIDSKKESIASSGWQTLSSLVATKDDDDLDIPGLKHLLERVGKTIHEQPNRVRYTMNGFVIAVGGYVKALTSEALKVGRQIGKIEVDMGNTSCNVPPATDYIQKMIDMGKIGKKKKTAKC
jgi:3-methyladenine DNA glycosylase AlkD